jgi:hypothetical protein
MQKFCTIQVWRPHTQQPGSDDNSPNEQHISPYSRCCHDLKLNRRSFNVGIHGIAISR